MKLKNKKTGEVAEFEDITRVFKFIGNQNTYSSLAEFIEEWEDYEEPKEYWTIDWICTGVTTNKYSGDDADDFNKSIGNYFETKEEAEKAVEKLKAWKRLKDANFNFKGWKWIYSGRDDEYYVKIEAKYNGTKEGDLDLLFGGEKMIWYCDT